MIQLRVLGDVDLRTDGGATIGSIVSQPRRLALLVYLAVESTGGGVQRDRLLGVFWPDQSQDQARQSLRTALHFLRRSLGSVAVEGQGGSVMLSPDVVRSDVGEFRAALEAGDAEAALRVYGGDLLPGFYLDGGPVEFERWLERTSADLRRKAAESAWTLARKEEDLGNAPGAGAWARRAAQLFHGDEAAVRRSIDLLGRVGDRVGALDAYQDLVRRLEDEYDAAPSPETEAAIARVRADDRGASPNALVSPLEGEAPYAGPAVSGPAARPSAGTGHGAVPRGSRPLRSALVAAIGMVLATAVLVAAAYALWPRASLPAMASFDPARESVIHIEDLRDFSPDDATADLAGAVTMELMGRLSDSDALRVVSLTRAGASPEASLRPGYILRGGLIRSDSVVRVTAILLDGTSGATLDRMVAETRLEAPTAMTEALAEALARRVRRQVGRAVEDYERGVSSRNERALALVREAIRDIEASDSLRQAGAAEVARAALASADSQLVTAQAMAPGWSEPSVQRAEIALRMMWLHLLPPLREPAAVETILRTGLERTNAALAIAPDDAGALELRGLLRYWLGGTQSAGSEAQNQEALRLAELDLVRATQLDAGRARAWSTLSGIYEVRGDYAAANLTARRAFRADPYLDNATEIAVRLFTTALEIGDFGAATRWCAELGRRSDGWLPRYCQLEQMAWQGPSPGVDADSIRSLVAHTIAANPAAPQAHARLEMIGAIVLARMGSPDAIGALRAVETAGSGDPMLIALEAWGLLLLGDASGAIAVLERAAVPNQRVVRSILLSRRFEALRAEPRVQALLAGSP
jgi:DNA-binding SARP family transcriptional activator/TolB-like protein